MKIAIARERKAGETRVAATPETVGKLIAFGASVQVEKGAGEASRFPDADYKSAGAAIAATPAACVKGADIVLAVARPAASALSGAAKGALVIGIMDPFGNEKDIVSLAKTGASIFAMELMPRITRAQVMDVLSSQANLAGYQAVIDASAAFDRAMPMMMTAAGTIRPAKVFVMGAGVAGLQAIATARRLGAVVSATDVRAAVGEQVESLGGKFIMTDALKDASGEGGYARELTKHEQEAQAELVAAHISKQDIVITTALIPGRPAPKLVTKAMVESMAPGSVIVDLAAERGGNCELTQPDKVISHKDVTIIGHTNYPARIGASASALYARNLLSFVETMIDKEKKKIAVDREDELVKATLLAADGGIVHPNISADALAKPTPANPAARKPVIRKSADAKPAVAKASVTEKPTPRKPATRKSATSRPALKKPAARKPASKKPAAKPSGEK